MENILSTLWEPDRDNQIATGEMIMTIKSICVTYRSL